MGGASPEQLFSTIQDQHERLFCAFNEFSDATIVLGSHPALSVLLDRLGELLLAHFEHEEQFMIRIGYPEANGHKWQHKHLIEEIEELRRNIRNGDDLAPEEVAEICAMFESHVMETDAELITFYRHRATGS